MSMTAIKSKSRRANRPDVDRQIQQAKTVLRELRDTLEDLDDRREACPRKKAQRPQNGRGLGIRKKRIRLRFLRLAKTVLIAKKPSIEKRKEFRAALKSGKLLRFPGAFSPLVAMAIQRHGFDGVYVSGAALSADLGLPDIGLTTLSEVAARGGAIARATDLPALIDADTGFGEALNVARTIQTLEDAGLCGCHLEDQVNPKRCGHLDNKSLVTTQAMVEKIRAAASARRDRNFVIMARTDARAV